MQLSTLLVLLVASVAIAALPRQHAQLNIQVDLATKQVTVHSDHPVTDLSNHATKNSIHGDLIVDLPFKFFLRAGPLYSSEAPYAPLGFEDGEGLAKIGFNTLLKLYGGKLIVADEVVDESPIDIFPPRVALLPKVIGGKPAGVDFYVEPAYSGGSDEYVLSFQDKRAFVAITSDGTLRVGQEVGILDLGPAPRGVVPLKIAIIRADLESTANDDSVRNVL